MGEVQLVGLVAGVPCGRSLIGAGRTDVSHQPFEVVTVLDQLFAQRLEQLGIAGRIAHPHVVDRFYDADPEEVGPNSIGHAGGEERVFRRREPLGQHPAAVLAGHVGLLAAEELRLDVCIAYRVLHAAGAPVVDDRLPVVLARLAAYLAEERGKPVVVVHRPAVEGMIVALGTLDPQAHEHLGHVLGRFQRVTLDLVKIGGRVPERAAAGGQQLANHLVQRLVAGYSIGEPGGVEEGRLVAHLVARLNHQQLGPFHRPNLGKLLPLDQPLDELAPLVRRFVGQKLPVLVFTRQSAHNVDRNPAQENLVAANLARQDPQLAEFDAHKFVDVVGRLLGRRGVLEPVGQHYHLAADRLGVEPGQHEGLAPFVGGNQPAFVDRRRGVVVREVNRQRRNVSVSAVGIFRSHNQRLTGAGPFQHSFARINLDRFDRCGRGAVVRSTGLEPLEHGPVVVAVYVEPLSTGVRNRAGRLLQNQTLPRHGKIDSPEGDLSGEPEVIARRIVAEQRKAKPVLTPGGPVAASRVASGPHEYRHHVLPETDRRQRRGALHSDRHKSCLTVVGHLERGLAVGNRQNRTTVESNQLSVGRRDLGPLGHVLGDTVAAGGNHDKRLPVAH